VFHILNNFDIPLGLAREERDGEVFSEYTSVTTARDPKSLRFSYKTHTDQTLRTVDLNQFNLDAVAIVKPWTSTHQPIVDMSSEVR
jgi:choloylglycine hydrolase